MLILSRVCADFRDRNGAVIYRVTPQTRLTFQEAPEEIRKDPLFQMLVQEGSLEAGVAPVRRKELENDPLKDADASGKKRLPEKSRTESGSVVPGKKTAVPKTSES